MNFRNCLVPFLFFFCVSAYLSYTHAVHGNEGWNGLKSQTEMEKICGPGDCGSYIKYSRFLVKDNRKLNPQDAQDRKFIYSAWPPGLPSVITLVRLLTGESYYVLKMMILSCLAWTLLLTLLHRDFNFPTNPYLRMGIMAVPLFFESVANALYGYWSINSEWIAMLFFVLFLHLLVRTFLRDWNRKQLLGATVAMALASLFRAVFDPIGQVIFGMLLAAGVVIFLIKKKSDTHALPAGTQTLRALKLTLVALVLFNVLLSPWRMFLKNEFGQVTLNSSGPPEWYTLWGPTDSPYLTILTGNSACRSDPALCAELTQGGLGRHDYKHLQKLAIKTLLKHPVTWFKHRAEYFWVFWSGEPWGFDTRPKLISLLQSLFFIGFGIGGIVLLAKLPFSAEKLYLAAASFGFVGINAAIFTFYHYELRYSLPLRFFCVFLPFWVMMLKTKVRTETA